MKRARLGRWHSLLKLKYSRSAYGRRNEESPFRALTHHHQCGKIPFIVEMKRARLGRWHILQERMSYSVQFLRRNEESPFRALTLFGKVMHLYKIEGSRNEESPFRALTHPFPLRFWHYAGSCRNEKSPICTRRLNEKKYRPTLYICYRKVTKSLFQDMYCILSR